MFWFYVCLNIRSQKSPGLPRGLIYMKYNHFLTPELRRQEDDSSEEEKPKEEFHDV